ncbi:flagellar motor protein MotD [Methylomonas sp. MED-D]|uniref:Flagellar motor protein MotB n=1 Tax=Methylomonas koyamae TaxID=702114 RepID=A0A177P6J7_9GAMM|nr:MULTISPECIES: flagellar motor protein MotD [Methylomonas]NJA08415.1 flagellar motor protein MotD [Methylococcaceae bacterium WWC4]MDT4330276.1 flagellar motor protein MotD [Methylomonas sp. MV1]OAI25504.1 flagellar motor protein MotB [Methylomonas koyamae]OHX38305.1 flagellar motor protein MotB [Methylomonas sp. LWB]WGS86583.1 flagellar motor protein MotD [Methylomonas sp. UP202]
MVRRRRKPPHQSDNHDRWMVSYADFVTLLFAFFVVMYSISSVNKGKYETFSESLDQALFHNEKVQRDAEPIQIGAIPTTVQPIELPNLVTAEERELSEEIMQEKRRLDEVSQEFQRALQPFVESQLVGIKKHDFWVELEMNSELLFASGKAELSAKAIPVLQKVAEAIRDVPNVINVEGYTDNVPISTGYFPSNWDLSSARATSVVKELVKNNIPSTRLSAVGYGEFHPIADNNHEEGRFKNRRVVLVLMSQAFARYGMSDDERAKALNLAPQPPAPPEAPVAQPAP